VSVIIVQTDRGARHCLGLVVGGLRDGSSPSGDIFVAGQNIIIKTKSIPPAMPNSSMASYSRGWSDCMIMYDGGDSERHDWDEKS
jgi:hypothetical protein